ncbi:hypothetical protein OE88DRAFT_1647196 [Heliocybe sulcata]|uniref:Nudix hydrolase domain-containing protein n=1 Tax=Heliocybe sulcata TaxID=5364 RepID=A0A5C3MTW2_9AGAM|nr:hypothetical protein OE88DRAFT_1647196 [Heliocybe sulcata]
MSSARIPSAASTRRRQTAPLADPRAPKFSHSSSPAVPDSLWYASDFVIGAGMVIIQPSTRKIVVVYDGSSERWFLPKGRKDVGESIEEAALREAYEESGYRAQFLPLLTASRAPAPGSRLNRSANTEPIYVGTKYFGPRYRGDHGGEYLTFWYVGCIDNDAVREERTGMSDEQEYVGHLLTPQQAIDRLSETQAQVVRVAWALFLGTYGNPQEQARQGRSSSDARTRSQSLDSQSRKDKLATAAVS